MSQVIVTKDQFQDKRERTRKQEEAISKEAYFSKWRMNDITKPSPVMTVLGLAVLPIALLWGLVLALGGIAMAIFTYILKVLSKPFHNT